MIVTYFNSLTMSVIETGINMGPEFKFPSKWNCDGNVLIFIKGVKSENSEKNPRSDERTTLNSNHL